MCLVFRYLGMGLGNVFDIACLYPLFSLIFSDSLFFLGTPGIGVAGGYRVVVEWQGVRGVGR